MVSDNRRTMTDRMARRRVYARGNRDEASRGHTVGEVAALTHVTVRALHHYDEIGLVSPSARSDAGYRLYQPADLARLQQVLFYRELGFRLDQIRELMADPNFDRVEALREQRRLLAAESERLRAVLTAVDAAIAAHEGGYAMSEKEMFEVFGDFDPREFDTEVEERWGETDAYRTSAEKARSYVKADWDRIKSEANAIGASWVRAMDAGHAPASAEAMAIAEEHREHISRWFYECSPEFHRNLGEMYVADERFAATYEAMRPGLAQYVRDAVVANADAQEDATSAV